MGTPPGSDEQSDEQRQQQQAQRQSPNDSSPGQDDDEDEQFDAARARATIKAQREAERKAKAELAEVRKKLEAHEAAQLSEQEKLQQRAEKAEQELAKASARVQRQAVDHEIFQHAAKLNFVDPTDAVALIDRSGIEVDDDLHVSHVDKALNELVKAKPHLLRGEGESNRGGPPPTPRNSGPPDEREALLQKTREQRPVARYF